MNSNPWVTGPLELIKHGMLHIEGGNDFDLRIAMISIDNSVELAVKTFLALNRRSLNIERKDFKNSIRNFPSLLDLLEQNAPDKVSSEELDAIEQFHSLRNSLYHQGNGITVESNMVKSYSIITRDLISRLFDVNLNDLFIEDKDDLKLIGKFLTVWHELETVIKILTQNKNLQTKSLNLYKTTNFLLKQDIIDYKTYEKLNELRTFRNNLVHGREIPPGDIITNVINELQEIITILNNKVSKDSSTTLI